jgi:hypothetical protein
MKALLIIVAAIIGLVAIGVGGCALVLLVDTAMAGIVDFGVVVFTLAAGFFLLALILGALSRWLFRKASRMARDP